MAMRLTLRTLLAYLDDTLEPAEAKLIGQKVGESDTAQELINRIKEVTRRRRITTPAPGGPGAKVDPDNVAGYLDNALSPEQLAEVEELALASDVHLAEIATCHQILTIVLGEPASVPPTAYKRMYGLVKPPESNPQHQPPVRREAEDALSEGRDVDETLRLGLPALHGRDNWTNRLIFVGGAACVVALLGVALWQLLAQVGSRERDSDNGPVVAELPKRKLPSADKKAAATPKVNQEVPAKKEAVAKEKPPEKAKGPEPKSELPDPKQIAPVVENKKAEDQGPAPPSPEDRYIGQFDPPTPPATAVLLQQISDKKQPDRKQWTRLLRTKESARVLSNAPLVSLPGYRSVVQMDSGVRLTLWGNLREIWPVPEAFESLVTLHASDQFDLDLTLERGRIAVANPKDQPAKVRLRFANPTIPKREEVWDLTLLQKGTEVIANLVGKVVPGEQFVVKKDESRRFGPVAILAMIVVSGSAELKHDLQPAEKIQPPPAGPLLLWQSREGKVKAIKWDALPPWVQPQPPVPKDIDPKARIAVLDALPSLSTDLTSQPIDVGLIKAMNSNVTQKRCLVVRSAGAMDDLQRVIDALPDKELEVRWTAIDTLKIWIGSARDNDYRLFQQLQPTYSPEDALTIMTLLNRWTPEEEARQPARDLLVHYLTNKKAAIRELAHEYLLSLFPAGARIGYNALAPEQDWRQRAKEWQKLVLQQK